MTATPNRGRSAVLDEMHAGDIRGALGTIRVDDTAPRLSLSSKMKTLLAIVGPALIVMIGDNDAGAFDTYGQAGQDYGTRLLWTLLLLVPVLYVNQEMVPRPAVPNSASASTGSRRHRTGRTAKRTAPRACAVAIGIMPRVRQQYPTGKPFCAAQAS